MAPPSSSTMASPSAAARRERNLWKVAIGGLWLAILLVILSILPSARAQASPQNVTSLEGTWSSGSGAVTTGLSFFNPATTKFTTPKSGGVSYSFTGDGHWEQSKFTFNTSSTTNRCVRANMIWQHGEYTINNNGSLSLKPFPADGFIQVIDMCAGQTIQTYSYTQFELIPQWNVYVEGAPGFLPDGTSAYTLQMFTDGGGGVAGAPMAPLTLIARPPNMLPPVQLHEQVLNAVNAKD